MMGEIWVFDLLNKLYGDIENERLLRLLAKQINIPLEKTDELRNLQQKIISASEDFVEELEKHFDKYLKKREE